MYASKELNKAVALVRLLRPVYLILQISFRVLREGVRIQIKKL